MTVLEAGSGSGALTIGLSRAVGPEGRIVSVELREDHAAHARKAVGRWYGDVPANVELRVGDVAAEVEDVAPARIVLDLPEPWHVVEAAAVHQPGGGILAAYLPTVIQVQTLVEASRDTARFAEIEVKEFLARDWNVSGRSVRPEHNMVGHTGFLVFMRKTAEKPGA
jgi:tRNA (adenine57-N1/adenine58-N1)-methyltransferase